MNKQFLGFLIVGVVFWPVTLFVLAREVLAETEKGYMDDLLNKSIAAASSIHIDTSIN